MYFTDAQHEQNFNQLLNQYPVGKVDNQYKAAFYIVALPTVYEHCDQNPVSGGHGPYDWYFHEQENPPCTRASLSDGYRHLVKAGLNLYNNHKHSEAWDDFTPYLALSTWGDELFRVFVEACQVRRGRHVVAV
ncbi:DUF6075 family protein [Paenibacillus doosanensis]|uniref:DUF6075 family protein n=1 Tax=Paenibacillus doosanensis TaxID=1229154 RepID=UPI00217F9A22|nr:DUF6075 family protein [Paenibacillus doosanensis]MCS7460349.1 DUF6075 family protein [Paenibacillus doosanensis]